MKFSDAYKYEMEDIKVSEAAVNKVYAYSRGTENGNVADRKGYTGKIKFLRLTVAAACALLLLTTVYYNREAVYAVAQSVFGSFIFNMKDKQIDMGEIKPIKFDMDSFMAGAGVNTLEDEENNKSYWKNYSSPDEMEKETGVVMISSPLLEVENEDGINLHIMPNGYGHLNGQFLYGKYHVNVDGRFTYEGFKGDLSGYGYGTSQDDKYDCSYEASNGIKVYFLNQSYGKKLILQAGNILYQIICDAPKEDLKKLIDTFVFS